MVALATNDYHVSFIAYYGEEDCTFASATLRLPKLTAQYIKESEAQLKAQSHATEVVIIALTKLDS